MSLSKKQAKRERQIDLYNTKKLLLKFIEKETNYELKEKEFKYPPYFRYALFSNGKQITDYYGSKITPICELIDFHPLKL